MRRTLLSAVLTLAAAWAVGCSTSAPCCTNKDCYGPDVCSTPDCSATDNIKGVCRPHCQADHDCDNGWVCNAISLSCGCEPKGANVCGTCAGCLGN
jgi:hypothetical protein